MIALSQKNKMDLSTVAKETLVGTYILLENDDFCKLLLKGASVEELVNFVNENF